MIKPIIFTIVSHPAHAGFLRMKRSCEAWGWTLDAHEQVWRGDIQRWNVFKEQIPRYRAEGYTHALGLDSFDVMAVGPPLELEGAIRLMSLDGSPPAVIIAAEGAAWPSDYRVNEYPPREHKFWYAHSQIVVDLKQDLPEQFLAFHRGRGHDHNCDQQHFADLILDNVPGVAIDRACSIVQSLAHTEPWQDHFELLPMYGMRIKNKITGRLPIFMHGNGGADMSWIPGGILPVVRPEDRVEKWVNVPSFPFAEVVEAIRDAVAEEREACAKTADYCESRKVSAAIRARV